MAQRWTENRTPDCTSGCCHWCLSCNESLVSASGELCGHCFIENARDNGALTASEALTAHAALDALEERESACPGCEGGPCRNEFCDGCQEHELYARDEHERAHAPGRF